MSGEGFERFQAVHEDDGVAVLQEVLRGGGPAGARAEIINESDGVVLQGDSCSTWLKWQLGTHNLTLATYRD